MGQAQTPISAETQPLQIVANTKSSGAGNAVFVFDAPPQGTWWTGTLVCNAAPVGADFVATIGATQWGNWAGDSIFGPVQAQPGGILTITATGLAANTDYLLSWNGSSDNQASVQPIWPEPNATTLAVALATVQGSVDRLGSGVLAAAAVGVTQTIGPFTALHAYTTILLILSPSGTVPVGAKSWSSRAPAAGSVDYPPQSQYEGAGVPPGPLPIVQLLPIACAPGDTISLTTSPIGTQPWTPGGSWSAYGLTAQLTQQVSTPIGDPLAVYPVGGVTKTTVTAPGGNSTILVAPPAGFAYRIHSLGAFDQTTLWSDGTNIIAYTGGAAAQDAPPMMMMDGLIVTGALNIDNTGAAEQAFVNYDLVPFPTLQ